MQTHFKCVCKSHGGEKVQEMELGMAHKNSLDNEKYLQQLSFIEYLSCIEYKSKDLCLHINSFNTINTPRRNVLLTPFYG